MFVRAARPQDKSAKEKKDNHKPLPAAKLHNAILWQDPGDIATKNLFYGCGGEDGQPKPPFTFVDERKNGSNPKFDATDANGKKWRVKLGGEARPEVVASRLLWAIGYFADVDYVLQRATVQGLHMSRGKQFIYQGDEITDARFARKPKGEKRIADWKWRKNPFSGTREFNGLRVMMAVLNSWDLKAANNAVYSDKQTGQQIFLVSDVGASFGTNTLRMKNVNGKGNVEKYSESKFITHVTADEVSFGTPAAPVTVLAETGGLLAPMYLRHDRYRWIGEHIPRADARWVGSLLGQLTHQQLEDAFRAGDFPPDEANEYVAVVEKRIAELKQL